VPDRLEARVSDVWLVVVAVGVATVLLKAAGPVVLGGRALPPRLTEVVELLAPALFAALIVTQTVGGDRTIELDERLVGVAAGGAAVALKSPLLLVIAVAALATALARALL
jgi:branched-subunit amino acid transport protein